MPRFTILPADDTQPLTEITAIDAGAVLNVVGQLDCQEADILENGRYAFTVRLSQCGMWSIFQREDYLASHAIPSFG